jgi:hypothetical protein
VKMKHRLRCMHSPFASEICRFGKGKNTFSLSKWVARGRRSNWEYSPNY